MSRRHPSLIDWLLWLIVLAIWGLVVYGVLLADHPMPVVSRTWPDGACVAVEPEPFSCDALPRRYVTEWVASEAGK